MYTGEEASRTLESKSDLVSMKFLFVWNAACRMGDGIQDASGIFCMFKNPLDLKLKLYCR